MQVANGRVAAMQGGSGGGGNTASVGVVMSVGTGDPAQPPVSRADAADALLRQQPVHISAARRSSRRNSGSSTKIGKKGTTLKGPKCHAHPINPSRLALAGTQQARRSSLHVLLAGCFPEEGAGGRGGVLPAGEPQPNLGRLLSCSSSSTAGKGQQRAVRVAAASTEQHAASAHRPPPPAHLAVHCRQLCTCMLPMLAQFSHVHHHSVPRPHRRSAWPC